MINWKRVFRRIESEFDESYTDYESSMDYLIESSTDDTPLDESSSDDTDYLESQSWSDC
jgi:hypothetical protein